jgi:hypothetical protein
MTEDAKPLKLNGFRLETLSETFVAYSDRLHESTDITELRKKLGASWLVYPRTNNVFGVSWEAAAVAPFGTKVELRCDEQLSLVARMANEALPRVFARYAPLDRRPFTFLGERGELVASITAKLKDVPELVKDFEIRPRYELEARIAEPRDDEPFIGFFVEVGTRWQIHASLVDLQQAGVDLGGLDVVRRKPEPDQRRLVGRINRLRGDEVLLAESFGEERVSAAEVALEGTRKAFARCLKTLLGSRYAAFDQERQRQENALLTGPALEEVLARMHAYLTQVSRIELGGGLSCTVGERIVLENERGYQSVIRARPVEYCFDPARTKRRRYAWPGIEAYGPFSRETFAKRSPKLLVVFPDSVQGPVEAFLRALRDGFDATRYHAYTGGFAKVFGLANPQFTLAPVSWLRNSSSRTIDLYRQALETFLERETELPDAALVVILDQHADLPDRDNPYLHSKALLLMNGVPAQELRLSTLTQRPASLQYIMQNISVALYAKMGGVPWTVDHDLTINDEVVIGLGTCELFETRFSERRRYVGITTVFRGDGNYLLGNLSRECAYDDYPEALRRSTLQVLEEIRQRNGWRQGDNVRIVCHSAKPLRNLDLAKIMAESIAALGDEQDIEFAFVTVAQKHPFALADPSQQGIASYDGRRKGVYAPQRGTIGQLGRYQRLLSVTGPQLIKREDTPLPKPLLVRLHPLSTFRDLSYLTEQVLKFTSLSWRSTLPAKEPVTIYYSELIADLLARLRAVPDWSPATLNTKLRASKWFL